MDTDINVNNYRKQFNNYDDKEIKLIIIDNLMNNNIIYNYTDSVGSS